MRVPIPDERRKERAIIVASVADAAIISIWILVGIMGGSLTILAEAVRGTLMLWAEIVGLWVIRRVHRNNFGNFEFGTAKIEHACNTSIAIIMFMGALWIANGAVESLVTGYTEATPLGLALAAVAGMANLWVNVAAFVALFGAGQQGDSVILEGQIRSRLVKLFSSVVVQVALTVATLSTDPVIAAWADGLGAVFVAGIMALTSIYMLRDAIPQILDHRGPVADRDIAREVAEELAPPGVEVAGLRSRGSGAGRFVEIAVICDAGTSVPALNDFVARIGEELSRRGAPGEVAMRIVPREQAEPA